MAFVAPCVPVTVAQVPADTLLLALLLCPGQQQQHSPAPWLHRAQGAAPSHISMPGKGAEQEQAGSFHPSSPDVAAPRWKLHSSTPQCVWLFAGSHMLLHTLPCFPSVRENLYLWTCSGSKNQLVKIQLKQCLNKKQRPEQAEELSCTDPTQITDRKKFSC